MRTTYGSYDAWRTAYPESWDEPEPLCCAFCGDPLTPEQEEAEEDFCTDVCEEKAVDRFKDAGELLGIPLLDHIIIGLNDHYSYSGMGTMPSVLTRP